MHHKTGVTSIQCPKFGTICSHWKCVDVGKCDRSTKTIIPRKEHKKTNNITSYKPKNRSITTEFKIVTENEKPLFSYSNNCTACEKAFGDKITWCSIKPMICVNSKIKNIKR